jgi:hypothetical protein
MVFNYDPGSARSQFERQGFAHLKGILSDRFLDYLGSFLDKSVRGETWECEDRRIPGKKRQFLFDFPDDEDVREFRDGLARLTGIDRHSLTLSERHINVYDKNADPWPAPHKDRAASGVSIGMPIRLPLGSTVCVFPELNFGANREERAIYLTAGRSANACAVYQHESAVLLNEEVGDLVCFLGSSMFHGRVNSADTAILYVKVNDEGRDPLGENIFGDALAECAA